MSLMPLPPGAIAVIFANTLREGAAQYGDVAAEMVALAEKQPGYLGHVATRGADGFGITVSFWADEQSIAAWRAHPDHQAAMAKGRGEYYTEYDLVTADVTRHVPFSAPKEDTP